jgi:hypothetical protein
VVARGGVEPPTFRFSVGRSYQLSYLAWVAPRTAERESTLPEHFPVFVTGGPAWNAVALGTLVGLPRAA